MLYMPSNLMNPRTVVVNKNSKKYGNEYFTGSATNSILKKNKIKDPYTIPNKFKFQLGDVNEGTEEDETYSITLENVETKYVINTTLSKGSLKAFSKFENTDNLVSVLCYGSDGSKFKIVPFRLRKEFEIMFDEEVMKENEMKEKLKVFDLQEELKPNSIVLLNNDTFKDGYFTIYIYQYRGYEVFPHFHWSGKLTGLNRKTHGFKLFGIIQIEYDIAYEIFEKEFNLTKEDIEVKYNYLVPFKYLKMFVNHVFKGNFNKYLDSSKRDSFYTLVEHGKDYNLPQIFNTRYFTNIGMKKALIESEVSVIGISHSEQSLIKYPLTKEQYNELYQFFNGELVSDSITKRPHFPNVFHYILLTNDYFYKEMLFIDFMEQLLKELYDDGYKEELEIRFKESVKIP